MPAKPPAHPVAEKAGDAVLTVVVEMALMRARELPKEQDG